MLFRSNVRTRTLSVFIICAALVYACNSGSAVAQGLTLPDVLTRVVSSDPNRGVNAARIDAASAALRQADFGPRPVVGVEAEDFAGSGPFRAADRSQTTAYYEQTWERGGKRSARIEAAQSELSVARQRSRVRMLDVLEKVQVAWVEALAAEAAIPAAQARLSVAETIDRDVGRRVARALDPLFAAERSRTALAQAKIARDLAVENARIARQTLSTWWGGMDSMRLDVSPFFQLPAAPTVRNEVPDIELLAAERDAANASIRLAEANSSADPTVRLGVRHFGQGNDVALVVGGSFPLGTGQANRNNIERAQANRVAAEGELAVALLQRRRDADKLAADRAAITTELSRINVEVLPAAERAAALVVDGFNRGGAAFTFLEVAEAQRALVDARTRRIELLRRFHLDGARLDRLSGRHLSLIASEEKR